MSPLEQGGYEGGGDIGAAYIPTAHMYTDMFAKIGQAVIDVDARNKKKNKTINLKNNTVMRLGMVTLIVKNTKSICFTLRCTSTNI